MKDFTIGADPEFCCLKGSRVHKGDNFSERNCFGVDGGGVALEMRPDFSCDPLRVVSNIHKNFLQLVLKTPEFMKMTWRAGSFVNTHPIGGHIHFGGVDAKVLPVDKACNWLDQLAGSVSILIEDTEEGKKRRGAGYGRKSDHRTNDHGFEYRTMSSWLTSPYITAAILCLAKAVIHDAVTKKKTAPTFVVPEDFAQMRVDNVRKIYPDIWKEIQQLELYPQYQPQIDIINTLVVNKRTWFPKEEMKVSWGIVPPTEIVEATNESLDLQSIWKDIAK
jgi:hypothetical protein